MTVAEMDGLATILAMVTGHVEDESPDVAATVWALKDYLRARQYGTVR